MTFCKCAWHRGCELPASGHEDDPALAKLCKGHQESQRRRIVRLRNTPLAPDAECVWCGRPARMRDGEGDPCCGYHQSEAACQWAINYERRTGEWPDESLIVDFGGEAA